jgi:hypothetical protein
MGRIWGNNRKRRRVEVEDEGIQEELGLAGSGWMKRASSGQLEL